MTDSVAPVSGPPLVYPIQPIKPIVGKGGDGGVSAVNEPPPKSAPPPSVGRLLDISV